MKVEVVIFEGKYKIEFKCNRHINCNEVFAVEFKGVNRYFKVSTLKTNGDNTQVIATEHGYFKKLENIPDLDIRELVGLEVLIVEDEDMIRHLSSQSRYL